MYIIPREPSVAPPPTSASSFDRVLAALVQPRQAATTTTTTVASTATPVPGCGGQYSGGALAGAILGTFFGTLLLIYLFSVIKANAVGVGGGETVIVEKRTSRKRRSHGAESFHSGVGRPSRVYSTR